MSAVSIMHRASTAFWTTAILDSSDPLLGE